MTWCLKSDIGKNMIMKEGEVKAERELWNERDNSLSPLYSNDSF